MTSVALPPKAGSIGWHDLTVRNAEGIRDFYRSVVGWSFRPESMGEYDDFCVTGGPANGTDGEGGPGDVIAGICHARGLNADIPPVWLMYINVPDADKAAERCRELGGTVIAGPRDMGGGRFAVIQDPAGAVCALFTPKGGTAA